MSYDLQATQVTPPGAGTKVATSTTSTAAQNLSTYEGKWVVLKANVKTHLHFGPSNVGVATTDDYYLTADVPEHVFIPKSGTRSYFRAILATGTGELHYADASDGG